MKKQNNKSNITVFVGRSEQSDLRHLYLFVGWSEQSDLRHLYLFVGRSEQSDLRHLYLFVGWSEQSDLRHLYLFVGRSEQSDLRHLYLFVGWSEQSDLRQIAKNGYQNYFFFNHKKPIKTTHKSRRQLTLDQFYQKLPLCQNKLPYGNLLRRNIPMKFNDIHKQFAVKSLAKMMTRSEIQGRSR